MVSLASVALVLIIVLKAKTHSGQVKAMKTFTKQILSMASVLALYGCAGDELGVYRCPSAHIVATSDSWRQPSNVADAGYEVKLRAIESGCAAYVSGLVESRVEVAGYLDVYRGDVAPSEDFSVDVFVAAVDPNDKVIAQNIETIEIEGVGKGFTGPTGKFSHKFNELSFNTGDGFKVTSYRIMAGFRLNKEQLDANRVDRLKRLSPAEGQRQK